MWNSIGIALLIIETVLLLLFFFGRLWNKKGKFTVSFIGITFALNLALYLTAYFYSMVELKEDGNTILEVLDCIVASAKMFVGDIRISEMNKIAEAYPVFSYAYSMEVVLSFIATISAAINAFSHTIFNSFRVSKALHQQTCDIVIGSGKAALRYAKESGALLIPGRGMDKNSIVSLIENGYIVLQRDFTAELLDGRYFNNRTRYNLICPDENSRYFDYIDLFASYMSSAKTPKDFYLYVEVNEERSDSIYNEIIDKSTVESRISAFSSIDLLVREFVESHPMARYISRDFIKDDTSIRPDVRLKTFILGYDSFNREMHHQLILNNQLVKYEGEYKAIPVEYSIYDTSVDENAWCIFGLPEALKALESEKEHYFPLPDTPYLVNVHEESPNSRRVLRNIELEVREKNSFSLIVIDTGNNYRNIDIGKRLSRMLDGFDKYHIFIRSEISYADKSPYITYIESLDTVFTHDIIVNDSLSMMARQTHESYNKAQNTAISWESLDHFTRYSNIHSALNIRAKLNLLGLDYVQDGECSNYSLITDRCPSNDNDHTYEDFFTVSRRNALIAQEHLRWSVYHMVNEFLPYKKSSVTAVLENGKWIKKTKSLRTKKHACLTTFNGLDELSCYLAKCAKEKSGEDFTAKDFEYYTNDNVLNRNTLRLMSDLGYSVTELQDSRVESTEA